MTSGMDFNSLNAQQQSYYNQHVAKYGYAPDADNSTLLGLRGGGGGGGIAAINSAASPGSGFASGGGGAAASYAQQHMARYGYMPDSSNATYAALLAQDGGGGGGGGSSGGLNYNYLNPQQQSYYDQHVAKYGYAPDASNTALQGFAGNNYSTFQRGPTGGLGMKYDEGEGLRNALTQQPAIIGNILKPIPFKNNSWQQGFFQKTRTTLIRARPSWRPC